MKTQFRSLNKVNAGRFVSLFRKIFYLNHFRSYFNNFFKLISLSANIKEDNFRQYFVTSHFSSKLRSLFYPDLDLNNIISRD